MTVSSFDDTNPTKSSLVDASCFIEKQFPVAKLSMESYKERKAGRSQTITGLGRWWGRKPLVLVRAALLGLLMPASVNPEKDRDIFLKLLTMDPEGLWQRKAKPIPQERLVDELQKLPPSLQRRFLVKDQESGVLQLRSFSRQEKAEKDELQRLVFERMPYAEKLEYCLRPEQIGGPSTQDWQEINAHLDTQAKNLTELVQELGQRRFGHIPQVGDAFCGGGAVPFEAARLGCDAYGSDLSPVAALLAWNSLKIVGDKNQLAENVTEIQRHIYDQVNSQIIEWGIENNSLGWRADAYLYCAEVVDPESGWKIPLLPTMVIAEKNRIVVEFLPDEIHKCYDFNIKENVSEEEYKIARLASTISDSRLVPPLGGLSTPLDVIRRDLRMWEKEDIIPRLDDVFQERLYCVRWIETYTDQNGKIETRRHYRIPTAEDLKREQIVLELLQERFDDWQEKGYIPNRPIEPGYNTDQPIRERGWTFWHQLFSPRQLLLNGLVAKIALSQCSTEASTLAYFVALGILINTNSRLCRWRTGLKKSGGIGAIEDTFSNQALNTIINPPARGCLLIRDIIIGDYSKAPINGRFLVEPKDARIINTNNDIWITDPPYADAVNYHELADYFLAWYEKHITKIFPGSYTDSKRALAVKGNDLNFRQSMVACYKQLAKHMPDKGLQIVMFTHQDAAVWADLSLILWAAGLRVTAAWTIATETESAQKKGNYVQGTVLLVLRKRIETATVFLDEINHLVEAEVRRQLESMTALEDDSDPNFGDADYQLAAYAAALRVLTERPIEEIDPEKEILRQRQPGEVGPVEQLIRRAVKIACDHLVPRGLDPDLWKQLGPMERFYLKGLEVESHGEYRSGVYQELARGFGAADYTDLLATTKANETRLKSATEFAKKMLAGESFGGSLVRQCIFAIFLTVKDENIQQGLNWLHTELPDYWSSREKIIHVLEYLSRLRFSTPMAHWEKDANAAALLAGAVRNDHV